MEPRIRMKLIEKDVAVLVTNFVIPLMFVYQIYFAFFCTFLVRSFLKVFKLLLIRVQQKCLKFFMMSV